MNHGSWTIHTYEVLLALTAGLGLVAVVAGLSSRNGRKVLAEWGIRLFAALMERLLYWIEDYERRERGQRALRMLRGGRK